MCLEPAEEVDLLVADELLGEVLQPDEAELQARWP